LCRYGEAEDELPDFKLIIKRVNLHTFLSIKDPKTKIQIPNPKKEIGHKQG
jgi:hypothetical protein